MNEHEEERTAPIQESEETEELRAELWRAYMKIERLEDELEKVAASAINNPPEPEEGNIAPKEKEDSIAAALEERIGRCEERITVLSKTLREMRTASVHGRPRPAPLTEEAILAYQQREKDEPDGERILSRPKREIWHNLSPESMHAREHHRIKR